MELHMILVRNVVEVCKTACLAIRIVSKELEYSVTEEMNYISRPLSPILVRRPPLLC